MSPRFALAVLFGLALSLPAAADYRRGVEAWGRGDFATAARYFLPDAQAGDSESQYMMGRLYSLGDGVPKDFVQAWVWFDRAARQGHQLAREARDSMNYVLTDAQLAQARALEAPLPVVAARPEPAVAPVQQAQAAAPSPPQAAARPQVEQRQVVVVPRQGVVSSNSARLVAPGPTDQGRLLASGDLPGRVRAAQQGLRAAGYYTGPVDGALTDETRRAIREYQRDAGLPQTGLLNAQLEARLGEVQQAQAH
ncbi:MAG TPA: peptidoglycan-binding protein [Magnetospirillum sp.]|jgi:hypothetical protein|nr:peptidoglycan-binding protein [Magnetospirillum sp.]